MATEEKNDPILKRDMNISLIPLDAKCFYRFTEDVMYDASSIDSLFRKMYEITISRLESRHPTPSKEEFNVYKELYDTDWDKMKVHMNIYIELFEQYQNKSRLNGLCSPSYEMLQAALLFYSGHSHVDYFYNYQSYTPPSEFSYIFIPILDKLKNGDLIDFINPYLPLLPDLDEEGQVYHFVLTKEMLNLIDYKLNEYGKEKIDNNNVVINYEYLKKNSL